MINDGKYIGTELALFEKATHWKNYFKSFLTQYLNGDILEVGAGIGGTTALLCDGKQTMWQCLEPDASMAAEIQLRIAKGSIPKICTVSTSYTSELPKDAVFDAIIYIDVIEHIEFDSKEMMVAASHLKKGGVLIILVPAHQFLYSPFDKKIGHFRRYSKKSLRSVIPTELKEVSVRYLDSVGLIASLGNKILLRSSSPQEGQIRFWDSTLVPISKITDRFFNYNLGKSVLGIWKKE
jgi:2-polyprenyl-3-methyl-5-hydroxy-6-metoxy-1,4-benzoquinol methylase